MGHRPPRAPHPCAQLRLTGPNGWRITGFATNERVPAGLWTPSGPAPQRARCEDRIRNLKDTGMRTLPFRDYRHNQIWLEVATLASDLLAWPQTLAWNEHEPACRWEPKRLRLRSLATSPAPAAAHVFGYRATGPEPAHRHRMGSPTPPRPSTRGLPRRFCEPQRRRPALPTNPKHTPRPETLPDQPCPAGLARTRPVRAPESLAGEQSSCYRKGSGKIFLGWRVDATN